MSTMKGCGSMKKFMEALANSEAYFNDLPGDDSPANKRFKEEKEKYLKLQGKRALYKQPRGVSKVVTIKEAQEHYVRVSYKYNSEDYSGETSMCITYSSLICGDEALEVEQ